MTGSYLFARTLDIRSAKTLAGITILCFAVPTILFFVLYEPFWAFVRALRNKRK